MKRAAIYARYSSSLQKATSIEDQVDMARRCCDRNGWTVVAVFEDREMTGRNLRRPGLQRMKAAIAAGEIVVVVEALDSLTRRVADALTQFDLFQFQGTDLHSVKEGPQDFFRVLLGGFGAQQFSETISVHTRRGMQGAVKRGRRHTSAYGYRKRDVADGLNREIDPQEARIVRRIFREAADGRSARATAKGLNAIPAILAQALDDIETLLGDPDTVAQANEHLATLIRSITLTPDTTAANGLAAEIHLDLGSLRFRVGLPAAPDDAQS